MHDPDEGILLGTVTVTKTLFDDDIVISTTWEKPDGDAIAAIDAVGMLEMGKNMILNPVEGDDDD